MYLNEQKVMKFGIPNLHSVKLLLKMLLDQDAHDLRYCFAEIRNGPKLSDGNMDEQNSYEEENWERLILYIGITSCVYKISQLFVKCNMENCIKCITSFCAGYRNPPQKNKIP